MRKHPLVEDEYYHLYNRGVERRAIFMDEYDTDRFLQSVSDFNTTKPIGSIYEHSFNKEIKKVSSEIHDEPLVELMAYCLNSNHYHLLLKQVASKGISKFMQRLGTGYTNYSNERYKRSGSSFQGTFKSKHIDSNEYLLHVSVYINLNNKLGSLTPKFIKSSWEEYLSTKKGLCHKEIILEQFENPLAYKKFAESSFDIIVERKSQEKELDFLLGSLTPK